MMRMAILGGIFSLCLTTLAAQSIERAVIGTTGGYAETATLQLSSTVGEVATTTLTAGTIVLTQGFQQPSANPNTPTRDLGIAVQYQLFPNPASQQLTLRLEAAKPIAIQVTFTDLAGREIALPNRKVDIQNVADLQWDISLLPAGGYLLFLQEANGPGRQGIPFQVAH